jgi:ParB family chromosome partitioning protein
MNFKNLPLEWLQPGKYQPRRDFSENSLKELACSIQQQGIIEPLVVRVLYDQRFEILAGERRWRAAMMAGLSEVPCVIGDYNDQQAAAITLIENIQREDLNLIEEAKGYDRLLQEFHFKQDEVATLVGKSRSHIANILRLLSLSEAVQERIRSRELSLGHARMLVGLSPTLQTCLALQCCEQGWSVRHLEDKVRKSKQYDVKSPQSPASDVARLQAILAHQLGTPVEITTEGPQGGWLKIKFFDNETLTGLLEKLGLSYD